jgi:phosphoglycolate phosphatase-like HAD superfamily hydrolase
MPRRLVLFDIDGTLLTAAGAGRTAFQKGLEETYGPVGSLATHAFAGKTDPQIAYEVLGELGWQPEDVTPRLPALFERYLGHLAAELPRSERARTMPGVGPLLDALRHEAGVTLGLLTGNLERGAMIKLGHFGIADRFALGAYGSDHGHRPELPAIAVARAEAAVGHRHAGKEIVIIGDTEFDIGCGRALGVRSIAVATGPFGVDHLAEHDPDHVFADLSDTEAVLRAILG